MGKDTKSNRKVDPVPGQAGKGEIGILDQLLNGQPRGIGQFYRVPAQHKGPAGIGGPIMALIQIGHRFATKAQRPGPNIQ